MYDFHSEFCPAFACQNIVDLGFSGIRAETKFMFLGVSNFSKL
ncbi:hypothetical protein HMPREF9193_00680 [Treponema lecithinolyticum ATCC 700332]|uniref:Uncharacterized protein n=1 Tax=Treponema lecithinolyticum ATCC 700332 TaxID=1321815 RepID=A0ABN0P061_TRELE|nr:hypothetical protein HMPREF9193_00680 [Treponema lecithinolyticum ATCC 700332]